MRGQVDDQLALFHAFDVEDRIRPDHPLRDIKRRTDDILQSLHPQFAAAYSKMGRPGVPPERLLKALLLMALYSIRSERQLCEQIDLNLLFRWFLDLQPGDTAFDATTFTKNRKRLEEHGLSRAFFDAVVFEALTKGLCSEHFSVDGTWIESQASAKSFRPKGEERQDSNDFKPSNPDVDFHGQKRSNETHASTTDPEARLYRKGAGKEAKLAHMGHVLSENRHGLILGITASQASGTAEREATEEMLDELRSRHGRVPTPPGADKGDDDGTFFQKLEEREIVPHIPLVKPPVELETVREKKRRPGVEARRRMQERMDHEGDRLSRRCRKKVEECFGWLKCIAGLDRSRTVGQWKLRQQLELGAAAYNLLRMRRPAPVN